MTRKASTDHPVHEMVAARWSPYGFDGRSVSGEDLVSVFEAARWAPSSYNEQPWRYIVATSDDPEAFEKLLSCLVDANQAWARHVPVLALGVVSLKFARNDRPNRHAFHDLGLASASLTFEATSRGLSVHQMAGILPDRAREIYEIPEDHEAVTALAIGYAATDPAALPESIRERDTKPRTRRPLAETLFGGTWNRPSGILG